MSSRTWLGLLIAAAPLALSLEADATVVSGLKAAWSLQRAALAAAPTLVSSQPPSAARDCRSAGARRDGCAAGAAQAKPTCTFANTREGAQCGALWHCGFGVNGGYWTAVYPGAARCTGAQ